jgi:hypothetical protein
MNTFREPTITRERMDRDTIISRIDVAFLFICKTRHICPLRQEDVTDVPG